MYTIIIPTKKRPKTLSMQLQYLSSINHYNIKKIIILDSSKKNFFKSTFFKKSGINKNFVKKIKYLQFNENFAYSKKLAIGSKLVFTDKCLLISDDDFVNFDSLIEIKKKLTSEKNIIFATGEQYLINKNSNNIIPIDFYKMYREFKNNIFESKHERIKFYLNRKSILSFYGMFKTSYFKKICSDVSRLSHDYYVYEIFFNICLLYYGKSVRVPTFYLARHPNAKINYAKQFQIRKKSFNQKKVKDYFKRFIILKTLNKKFINKKDFISFFVIKKYRFQKRKLIFKLIFDNLVYKTLKIFIFYFKHFKHRHTINVIKDYILKFNNISEIKNSRDY